jgi:hypothetical protein
MEEAVDVTLEYFNEDGDRVRWMKRLTWEAISKLIDCMDNLSEAE